MHGCTSSFLIVNAGSDMGEVVESGVSIAHRTSPHRAAIEKVQAELREKYDVRDKRKRELEFLEKGGDPLDFKFGTAASVSLQSTSFTDQHPDQFVTSEVKGSFAFTASPQGDSIESSGRPMVPIFELNSSDNLLLYGAEHESSEAGRNSLGPSRSNNVPSELSSHVEGNCKALAHVNRTSFDIPRKSYKRRNRTRPNRDATRSSSTELNSAHDLNGSSLPSSGVCRDVKTLATDGELSMPSNRNSEHKTVADAVFCKTSIVDGQQDMEIEVVNNLDPAKDLIEKFSTNAESKVISSEHPPNEQLNQPAGAAKAASRIESSEVEANQEMEHMDPLVTNCKPNFTPKPEDKSNSCNGCNGESGGEMENHPHSSGSRGIKGLEPESSFTQTSQNINGNKDGDKCKQMGNVNSNEDTSDQALEPNDRSIKEVGKNENEKTEAESIHDINSLNEEKDSSCQINVENGFGLHPDEDINRMKSDLIKEMKDPSTIEGKDYWAATSLDSKRGLLFDNLAPHSPQNELSVHIKHQDSVDTTVCEPPEDGLLTEAPIVSLKGDISESNLNLQNEVDEDSILKEAQIIEAKRKRISDLSTTNYSMEIRGKTCWDYVLEEMAWLANDFAQERIWKIAAAAHLCSQVTVNCRMKRQGKSLDVEVNKVAHTLGKAVMEFWHLMEERSKKFEQISQKDGTPSVQAYAVRFLNYNNNHVEVPVLPVRTSDSGVLDLSWEDHLTEENLFYTIPSGAMNTYRKSIEYHVALQETIRSRAQEVVGTSTFDGAADLEYQDNVYDADEGETSTRGSPFNFGEKKRMHAHGLRPYEVGLNLLPQYADDKVESSLLAKRPGSSLNASIPTKRVRSTASRRIISPFGAETSGGIQMPNKGDASSGDTNSFQDDMSSLRCVEVESARDFEKQLPFDYAEMSAHPKKKKKATHLNVVYEQRWQADSGFQHGQFQRDHTKKRSETHQLESNGSSGLLGQPLKKPKIIRQLQDNSCDIVLPIGGSVPSPVASHMSNTSNPNKFMKILAGRDRVRKSKALKMPACQIGSGVPWSLLEDQALVVLVHDLGPNWELVSDAMNGAIHFKRIFRKSKDCKERHYFLMDRPGDGADSGEDSGSSQPYPSSLPGIPKGSARQLFQRLQEPTEESTIKSHFEKMITIGKKLHRKTQVVQPNQQPHSSHTIALSQLCLNNLNGGVLTPLDLIESIIGTDTPSIGYLSTSSSNQGTPIVPPSGACVPQGSPNMMLGNNFSSSPGYLSSPVSIYAVPRSNEQQRAQPYNHPIPGRNTPQSNISSAGALQGADRGVRILSGSSGMGCGVNRSMAMAKPGPQGVQSMVSSGSMVSPCTPPASMHSGVNSQGNTMFRPREALHMMRPDVQMPGNNQGHFAFPNQTGSPPVASYPIHHQSNSHSPQSPQVLSPRFQGPPNHGPTQQQAYAIRLAKERQMQNRLLQQQQFAASQAQTQSQLPSSSSVQNSSQAPNSPPLNSMPQPKHLTLTQGVPVRTSQAGGNGLISPPGKQRQKQQQFAQANRQHPLQRQNSQAHQLGKVAKGVGRGSISVHQNHQVEPSLSNGVSTNQFSDKVEPSKHLMQNQGLYNVSVQSTTKYMAPEQKIYSGQWTSPNNGIRLSLSHSKLVGQGQSQPTHRKLVRQNSQKKSELSNIEVRDSNSSDAVKEVPQAVSPANINQWHSSEQLVDSNALNSASNSYSLVSTPSNSNESAMQEDQRPSSAYLNPNRQSGDTQRQQQSPEVYQSNSPVTEHESLPTLQPQQQTQLLHTGNDNLFRSPSDH